MLEYHKIPTVFQRDPATKFRTLLEGQWATPELAYLADRVWTWTEKIDGTNVRVGYWPGGPLEFGGHSADSQLPPRLMATLSALLTPELLASVFDGPAVLCGEGYGAKIQADGDRYRPDQGFILFDVHCGGLWLERQNVLEIALKLGLPVVPIIGTGTLSEAVGLVRQGFSSSCGNRNAEGLVMRPQVELQDRRGGRIIAKIKTRDFASATPQAVRLSGRTSPGGGRVDAAGLNPASRERG